jgi:Secretion system C-terminal sorting domain
MKRSFTKSLILFLTGALAILRVSAQDASINILAGNNGVVTIGGSIFLQVDVTNNDATGTVVANKVRPQISAPTGITSISLNAADHTLPPGWTITSNSGSVIRITNTSDAIPAGATRTSFIKILGGPTAGSGTILANLTFVGAAPTGDNTANNSSSAGITSATTPVILSEFNALLVNCEPFLKWATESEINSDRFEMERSYPGNATWASIGTIAAAGNTTRKTEYSFTDRTLVASEKVLYRLKMIDKDGKYKYSPVLPVSINCNTPKVTVFPNPVQDGRLYISLTGAKGQTEAVLLTLAGQVILKNNANNGTNKIDVYAIANGVYILSVTEIGGNELSKKVKVLIQK